MLHIWVGQLFEQNAHGVQWRFCYAYRTASSKFKSQQHLDLSLGEGAKMSDIARKSNSKTKVTLASVCCALQWIVLSYILISKDPTGPRQAQQGSARYKECNRSAGFMFFSKQEVAGSTWIVVTLNGRKGFTPIPCNFTSTRKNAANERRWRGGGGEVYRNCLHGIQELGTVMGMCFKMFPWFHALYFVHFSFLSVLRLLQTWHPGSCVRQRGFSRASSVKLRARTYAAYE